ncbi:hypothetical protein GCM10010109_66660 [Actinoplanes campanulatus]|nr:hypothetical protein GCM10010109_66660 [Actinoplanes campanulatus]GID40243.1 hypothetical protein Aca09nite_67490 [Actinoplanes campanulatus]
MRLYGEGTPQSPAGVAVKDTRGGSTYLWGTTWRGETPVDLPEVLPPPKLGAQRIAVLAVKLLDAARPAELKAWRLVALPDLGPTDARGVAPAGVGLVAADGSRFLLRATHGGSQTGDPAEDPHPEWRVPEALAI